MRSFEGRTLGAYRLMEQVGIGGMAVVYKAYDPGLDRYVAIKLLPEYLSHDAEFSARFRAEARNVARLRHPNILPIYGYGEEDGLSYFVMDLVEGGTLKDLMGEPMEPGRAVSLIAQVADALNYAHEQGIVHRDVKPANVLMSRPDWAVLSDFGIARVLEQNSFTRSGSAFLGTPHYMAPEQARGEKVGPKTDQYALGIVLYEMLTGTPPFHADTPQAVVYQHIYASMPLPRERNPNISEAMQRVILKALAKDPEDRFASMAAFAAAARSAAAGAEPGAVTMPSDTVELPGPDLTAPVASVAATAPARSALTERPSPSTERLDITPVVRTVEPEAPEKRPRVRPQMPSWLRRWGLPALCGVAVLAAAAAILALVRTFGPSAAPVTVVVIAPTAASLPQLSILDRPNGSTVSQVTPGGRTATLSLKPGQYVIHFPSDSRYRMDVPVSIRNQAQERINLARRCTLLKLVAPAGSSPAVTVTTLKGQQVADLSQNDAQHGVWLLNGDYYLQFSNGSGYNGQIRVNLHSGRRIVNLAARVGFIRLVAAPHAAFQGADIDNVAGQYLFSLPSGVDLATQPQAIPEGRYRLSLSGTNSYLSPLPFVVRPGAHMVLNLGHEYGLLTVSPPPGGPLADFELRDSRTGNSISDVTGLAGQQGVYVLPGRYVVDLTGSNIYLDPLPVTVVRGRHEALDLGGRLGHLSVIPFPGMPVPTFDIKDGAGKTTIHYSVDSKSAGTGVYLLPGRYTFVPNSSAALDPVRASIRAGRTNTLNLAHLYGALQVQAAPGLPLESYDIKDAVSRATVHSLYGSDVRARVYLRPGEYTIAPSASSSAPATYLDSLPVALRSGKVERLDLGAAYARLQIPAVSSQDNVSYSWRDSASNTVQNIYATAKVQVEYIRPGAYRIEVTRNGAARVIEVRATVREAVKLPQR